MREIKYRAWIDREKKLVDVSSIEFDRCGFPESEGKQILYEISYRKRKTDYVYEGERNVILMQYTGLQDKHGKEIYEGDVLASVSAMQKETGYVVFDNGAFCLVILSSRTTKTDSKYFLSTCKELEIIGNIYENPELLGAD